MSDTPSVFVFDDYRSFLRSCLARSGKRKQISLRQWSQRLGYRSPRGLAMVLDGSRHPSTAMLELIARDLTLTPSQRRFLQLLVQREQAESRRQNTAVIEREIQQMKGSLLKPSVMQRHTERFVSEWYMLVIKNLAAARGFKEDFAWIAAKLRGKINPREARLAIADLLSLKILRRDKGAGRLVLSEDKPLYSTEDIPSTAIRTHHEQMLKRASEALEEQEISEREFISLNIPIEKRRLSEVKTFIREFRDRFNQTFDATGSLDIGQLNIQFFLHTKDVLEKPKRRKNQGE